jgi:surface antigen
MRLASLAMALVVMALIGMPSAEARRYDSGEDGTGYSRTYRTQYSHTKRQRHSRSASRHRTRHASHYRSKSAHHGRRYASRHSTGGRPRKWCGWWMRTQLGGGPEYNLAANWRHYGRPSGPQVGAVVVWPHHVGIINGRAANGRWIVKSGNDGGRVRERARSVAGAVFRVG